MRFGYKLDLLNKLHTLCLKNDKKTKATFCCHDFYIDLSLLKNMLDNKQSFQVMIRKTGFESQDYRIDGFKSFLKPESYVIYNVSYRKGCYHLIKART